MLYGLRPQEETQSDIAQFPQWFKLLSTCRKNTAVGMCGQSMIWIFRKLILFVLLTITSMTSPVKTQQCILFLATCFDLKGHDQFEHKFKRMYVHYLYGI
jgi:hypothetical protein